MPGAFSRTLAEHKSEGSLPMMFWMHQPDQVPGKWLSMTEDEHGLQVKGILADTTLGNDIHTLLKMKAVSGLSIGYIPTDTDYNSDGVRLIKQADLIETSIVSIPMNPKAQIVHAKARLSERGEYVPTTDELASLKREVEHFLKTKGFSKNLAKTYVSNLFRDSGVTQEDQVVTTDNKNDDLSEAAKPSSETPEEMELRYGLESFHAKQEAYDIQKILDKYFRS